MSNRRIELLQNMPIFGVLAVSTLELILELSRPAVVAQGDFFFRQGNSGTSTFVLESGRVAILRSHQGRDHLLRHLGPGDCFGEVALIDFGPRSTSVRAEAEATTLELQASTLLKIAKHDLEQYAMLYMNLARELARRLRVADDRSGDWVVTDRGVEGFRAPLDAIRVSVLWKAHVYRDEEVRRRSEAFTLSLEDVARIFKADLVGRGADLRLDLERLADFAHAAAFAAIYPEARPVGAGPSVFEALYSAYTESV